MARGGALPHSGLCPHPPGPGTLEATRGHHLYFINDGIESALRQAQAVGDGRDIRIAGGADVIRQYLNAGLVDEIHVALSPVVFDGGTPLFAGVDPGRVRLEIDSVVHSPKVTHLQYAIRV